MAHQFFPTAEGFYDYVNSKYIYQYKDHLGNVRISYKKDGNGVETTDQNDYYPFGMNIPREEESIVGTASLYNYKYNGKELQETGMFDYGARMYMPDIGRWGVVDPLAEKYTRMSPYTYVGNNPAIFVDYDGRDFGMYIDLKAGTVTIKATYYTTSDGLKSANLATTRWNNTSDKYTYNYTNSSGQTVALKIKFALTTSVVDSKQGEDRLTTLNNITNNDTTGEANSYRLLADNKVDKSDSNENGATFQDNIMVRESQADNDETGTHEIGHSLGANHTTDGVMTPATNSDGRSADITNSTITDIMNTIKSNPQNPNQSKNRKESNPLGEATIHMQNNNLKNEKDYRRFRNGTVKSTNP